MAEPRVNTGRAPLVTRRTAAVAILAVWLGSLGWLAIRRYGTKAEEPARWPVPPGSSIMAVNLAGRQVGLSTLTVDTLVGGELRVTDLTTIDLPRTIPGTPRRTSERTEAFYSRALQLRRFESSLLTEHGRLRLSGVVAGDTLLRLIGEVPGEASDTQHIALRRPIILSSAVPLAVASRGLPRPGSRVNLEVFDPMERELRVEHLLVAAESTFIVPDSAELNSRTGRWEPVHLDTVRAWRLDAAEHGLPTQLWLDGTGLPVRIAYPLGASLDRSAFEIVQVNFRAMSPPTYDTSSAAPRFDYPVRPDRTRGMMRALARLTPDTTFPPDLPLLTDAWQTRVGDTFHVGGVLREIAPDTTPAGTDPVWSLVTPDSSVVAAARAIVGGDTTPARAGELLATAVRKRIRPVPGESRQSAAQVLAGTAGTEQEQVNLLVSLGLALGLHARSAWGLVHHDGQWVLRPWAEIRTDRWTPFDPAQPGHDAGRIRLATGGSSRFLTLVIQAGRVRLQVLEERP